jgi:uncharacterized protein (TIGR03118 family)
MLREFSAALLRLSICFATGAVLFSPNAFAQHFIQKNLVTDKTDTNLVNGWGISRSSTSPWWVSNNGTNTSTLYSGEGVPFPPGSPLVVSVPGAPTGTVWNGTQDFKLKNGNPARFLFATESGTILGWNGGPPDPKAAEMVVPPHHNAVYKGLAVAQVRGANYLLATDFHNSRVEVFDGQFNNVTKKFRRDPDHDGDDDAFALEIWSHGFAPFGIQNLGGTIFVTFAKQDADKEDDSPGPGNGFVAAFTQRGRLIRILEHGPWLNSPWGLTLAPGDFSVFSHTLLVGMFGNGTLAAYNVVTGRFLGLLLDTQNKPIKIDGLWGIGFGGGNDNSGPFNTLFFAAGPNGEKNGLFGTLTASPDDLNVGNGR